MRSRIHTLTIRDLNPHYYLVIFNPLIAFKGVTITIFEEPEEPHMACSLEKRLCLKIIWHGQQFIFPV